MHTLPRGKNISIHFTDDELSLLSDWEQHCRRNYTSKSGWVKRNIHKELKEVMTKMKTLKVEDITEQMLKELSKKSSMKEEKFLDELVSRMYMEMKRTGRKVL